MLEKEWCSQSRNTDPEFLPLPEMSREVPNKNT